MAVTIGFIGLGNLGSAMAGRLADQGIPLVIWNRTRSKAESLAKSVGDKAKLTIAQTPADLASRSDLVILNLFDTMAVKEVIAGVNGIFETDCRGKVIIDTTTNHFSEVGMLYGLIEDAGGKFLEAPVLGSVLPASQGTLTMLVSGDRRSFDTAKPTLDILAKTIFYLEQRMVATQVKLINNLVLGSFMGTIAEALAIGDAVGIERAKLLEMLAAGAGNSAVLNAKRQKLVESDFSPHFSVGAIHKDLEYLKEMAASLKHEPVMGEAARRLFHKASKEGLKEMDLSAVIGIMTKKR